MDKEPFILAIESSCDETSAAVLQGKVVLSNVIAAQKIHEKYGGVVPELASRAHQSNIVPVVDQAIRESGISLPVLSAIAFTRGPGLLSSLHVGSSFAKSMSLALDIPLIAVHHMKAHVLAHFIQDKPDQVFPDFPFLCLTVSGGHTQIVKCLGPLEFEILGETIDDAAGEAFDKAAALLGLPYPGGPQVDKLARSGDPALFSFPLPQVSGYNYSFSGLKTSLLYFLRDKAKEDENFIEKSRADICASYQKSIVDYLLKKFVKAATDQGIHHVCLAGGVSANSELRKRFEEMCNRNNLTGFIPPFAYCTDNAAMIGIAGYFQFKHGRFSGLEFSPDARLDWNS